MNAFDDRTNPVDEAAIDRLVDGCLSEAERRELLLELESDPEGWRRCALAFLEDQAWRQALGVAKASEAPAKADAPPNPAAKRRFGRLSIAATLLIATFAAGFSAGGRSRPQVPVETARGGHPAPEGDGQIREVGSIDVVDGSAGESPVRRLPIYSGPGLDDRWLEGQPSPVPAYVKAQWERQGYQVGERRKVVSVVLQDGRRVSLPVDEVELDYVGQKPL